MVRTPGFVLPSSFPTKEALVQDLQRRAEESGFVPFDPSAFLNQVAHEDSQESTSMSTEVDNYLEHYGVKGMKWGKRSGGGSSSSGSSAGKTRKELRALDRENRKAVKAKAKKDWDDNIEKARDRVGDDARAYNEAKKQYKTDKKVIGKVAAREVLKKHESQFVDSWNTATLATTKERNQQLIVAAGLMTMSAIVSGVAAAS